MHKLNCASQHGESNERGINMTNLGKVQGTTTVTFLGQNNKMTQRTLQAGETAVFNLAHKVENDENVYKSMGMSLSSFDERAAEPQGDEAAAGGQNVTVGDNNGTTVIIIGRGNNVSIGGTGKADEPDDVDDVDDADDTEEPGDAEEPGAEKPVEDKNKTIIDTLKDIIIKLLELIAPSEAEKPEEPAEETPDVEQPKAEKPAEKEPKTDKNAQKINTLKDVIIQLLGLIEAEPAKAEEKAEDKEKEEKTEEV